MPEPTSKQDTPKPRVRLCEIEGRQERLLSELDRLNGQIEQALESLTGQKAAA